MKNAAVATTTSRGVAVSSSRATAVQSVYIAASTKALAILSGAGLFWMAALLPVQAGVVFDNCQPTADGGITCDTRPTGNTLMDAEAARDGLFQQASPGWNEFNPVEGYDEMFGGNET